ncbi:MAG: metal ABC transporter permease [Planctomycetaceae bacterium]|nr:metal ABC transporter permease [Planctomycetaceae bacterium]
MKHVCINLSRAGRVFLLTLSAAALMATATTAADDSLTDRSLQFPDAQQWTRVLTLQDYNTRVVVLGVMLLGAASGAVGCFTLLRRRALMGDALAHATLPGVCGAFLLAPALGIAPRSPVLLLCGATVSGVIGVMGILFIRRLPRLREDAALCIVLSVFFGIGVTLLGVIQDSPNGHAAGLEAFIYGKTASMRAVDAWMIAVAGAAAVVTILLLLKELTLLCFDEGFAGADGFPVTMLDSVLMSLVVVVTIVGLQAVGLVLMIALLVIPAAAARFWTHDLRHTLLASAGIGGLSGYLGATVSALFRNLPSGATIVLVASLLFLLSMLAGLERGALIRLYRRVRLHRSIDRQHLLRGMFEIMESRGVSNVHSPSGTQVSRAELLNLRSWSAARLKQQIARSVRDGEVAPAGTAHVILTEAGFQEAQRLVREHRLWELYLILHADVAPAQVDREADAIEHVLDPLMIQQLEELLEERGIQEGLAASPHPLEPTAAERVHPALESGGPVG